MRLERYLCFFSTLCTNCVRHFSSGSVAVLGLSCLSAFSAPAGFILKTLGFVKLLFTCGENELLSTILTHQCFVFVHYCPLAFRND